MSYRISFLKIVDPSVTVSKNRLYMIYIFSTLPKSMHKPTYPMTATRTCEHEKEKLLISKGKLLISKGNPIISEGIPSIYYRNPWISQGNP